MRHLLIIFGIFVLITGTLLSQNSSSDFEKNWHQWRGPSANGVSPNGNPPTEWGENKNIKWKIEIPGKGYATPIIWGDQIFISTAIETDKIGKPEEPNASQGTHRRGPPSLQTDKIHKFVVLSINRNTGKIQWQREVKEELPQKPTHRFGSWASNSPVTDGKHVYAYFGSQGLFCLDMKGNLKWERDFGQMNKAMNFGEGCSPVLQNNKIIVLWDHEGESFIIALDKNNGKNIWKIKRDEVTSWATPLIVDYHGKTQIITSATNKFRSYDAATGELLWQGSGLTRNVIPTPLASNNIVYLMSGFRGSALFAIDLAKAKGDVSNSEAIVWQYHQDTPYTPSPLLMDNMLYFLKVNNGSLSCLDARDGKAYYSKQKLAGTGNLFTSPAAAQNRIYIVGRKGLTYVIKHGPTFEVLAKNQLDDNFQASPAIIGNDIYLRGFKYLYCIGRD